MFLERDLLYMEGLSPPSGSPGSSSLSHHSHRADKDHQVEPERPVAGIPDVEPNPRLILTLAPSGYLPEPGDSGFHQGIGLGIPPVPAVELLASYRARPHETHLAPKHVENLGKLVEAGPSEKVPDSRDSWIFCQFVILRKLFF